MGWTDEQQRAIDFRDGNLLVSAAAGSGKTAVLVERIIRRVTDPVSPIEIDSIVVVTFTRAAAEEMKSRLANALEKLVEKEPGNRRLIKQLSLLDNAKITTIDSFCAYILRNYYNTIGFDPAFRVADAGELSLMRSDTLDEVLEEKFAGDSVEFRDFVEAFAPGREIGRLKEMVLGLYDFAQSNPWPDEWLEECLSVYSVSSREEYEALPVVKDAVSYIRAICLECAGECGAIIRLCGEPSGPACYIETVRTEKALFEAAAREDSLSGLEKALSFEFGRLPAARGADAGIKERVKNIRDGIKKRRALIAGRYLSGSGRQYGKLCACRGYADVIVGLVRKFSGAYRAAKTDKNIVDFADIEHYALDILIEKKDGILKYTETSRELAEEYEEIYIDEYQDSNLVQEYILGAVSKERFGQPNTFMVGDVKQSIYKFRMARPELFMEKYGAYSEDGGKYARVELHRNFRSRANVLECINDVFYMSMKKEVGGVAYSDEVCLNYGGSFGSGSAPGEDSRGEGADDATEIIVADRAELEEASVDTEEAYAHMAARRIKALVGEGWAYRDIVILLRSDKKSAPVYAAVLKNYGIPSVHESSTGYFDAAEVKCVMDLLRVIDNPRQEIALAGVMRSYFAYFTAQELALIKGKRRRTEFYDCVRNCAETEGETAEKCRAFLLWLDGYRDKARTSAIKDLLSELIYNTGYYDYAGTLGAGASRQANLDMLVQKAREFEQTSYSGLFNFLRYVDKIRRYDVDYGDARTVSEADDVVRIMSIHKSKGLEFPVVIIGDTARKYNTRDVSEPLIYDSSLGLGLSLVDLELRVREEIPYKNMLARRMTGDSIGEELRILYVAMTRAAQKLILLGITGLKTAEARWEKVSDMGHMNMAYITENRSYLDIVMPCALQTVKGGRFVVEYVSAGQLFEEALKPVKERASSLGESFRALMEAEPDGEVYGRVREALEYKYPHSDILSLRTKYSVSELKHQAMEENGNLDALDAMIVPPDSEKPVPCFVEERLPASGTFRGNAYHKVFELLDYSVADNAASVEAQLDLWVGEGRIGAEYRSLIDCRKFEDFINSSLGKKMKAAALRGELFREQPFAMEAGADLIDPALPPDERVLVQGVIDAFYFEGDKVFVVDYKTDRVPGGADGELILAERYRKQLELYCDAVKKVTGRQIGGCFIYSVSLGRPVSL